MFSARLKILLGAFCLCLAFASSGAAPASAQDRPTSFLDGGVTFKIPAGWEVVRHINTGTHGNAELKIPYPAAEKAKHRARVFLSAGRVPEKITVRHLSDGVYENKYEGMAVLSDAFDGDEWRTVVWTAKVKANQFDPKSEGIPYLMLQRFGLAGRKSAEVWAILPMLKDGDPKFLDKALAEFNEMCAGLKIDGRNRFESGLSPKKISELLKAKK